MISHFHFVIQITEIQNHNRTNHEDYPSHYYRQCSFEIRDRQK